MYLFIIGSTWECPSGYRDVSASIYEVTLSVWGSPVGGWPEAQALPHQEKLFFFRAPDLLLSVSTMTVILGVRGVTDANLELLESDTVGSCSELQTAGEPMVTHIPFINRWLVALSWGCP